jgi:hypothetical protein
MVQQMSVRLNLQIVNLRKLHQQLNSEGFNALLSRFEAQLQALLRLYNGERQLLSGDQLLLDFCGEDRHECSFRALCCAQILMNLAAQNPSPRLQLAGAIQPLAKPAKDCMLAKEFLDQHHNPLHPSKNEILVSGSLLDTALLRHAEFDLETGKLLLIKAPYSDYVTKQEAQLLLR